MGRAAGEELVDIDPADLAKAMLDAARAARIGVTVTRVDTAPPRLLYVNEAAATILGWSIEELFESDPMSHISSPDRPRIDARLERRTAGEQGQSSYDLVAIRKDGSQIPIEVTATHAMVQGRPVVVAFIVDTSARREQEQERHRNEAERKLLEQRLAEADRLSALGTLAAGVAHEINNPLAYVMLNLEWVARKLPSVHGDAASLEGLTAMLTEARQGVERVSTIVRELRSFSRIEGEARVRIDLGAVVDSALKIVAHEIRPRARVVASGEPVKPVLGSQARLEQVVVNLLLNAAQAMEDEHPERNEIRVSVRPDGEGHAVLEVNDNGPGIPADVLPRIFDPFFTTKPVGLGTGLGLSICHGIVMALGGRISVYSDAGEGASFRVRLPTVEPEGEAEATATLNTPSSRVGPRARILVVDAEQPIANTLRELLAPVHEVVAATSGAEALAALDAGDFDVVFCDLTMPGMSGVELYQRICVERPALAPRVVFMTGGAFTEQNAEFLASVHNRRVEKPFSLGIVERIVRDLMEGDVTAPPA